MALALHFRDAVSLSGRFPLLAGVTLDVAEGEVVYLRGPNGAGKTSLLRACAGLVPISSGEAEVLGHDLRGELRELRRQVGLLGHANFLYQELSVLDNLRFGLKAARARLDGLDAAIERLELGGRLLSTRLDRLSTGQARRVALALVLARSPRLWLLDEPHAGIDEDGRSIVDSVIRDVAANGNTVLIASHEHDRALALANRCVEIDGGMISAAEPAARPRAIAGGRDVA